MKMEEHGLIRKWLVGPSTLQKRTSLTELEISCDVLNLRKRRNRAQMNILRGAFYETKKEELGSIGKLL